MQYTTKPSTTWPGYVDIYEGERLRMSTPAEKADESIAYLEESNRKWVQRMLDRVAALDPKLVIANGVAYSIGSENDYPKGFGGDKWIIFFRDGREIITTSLWHLGEIPQEWRADLPDNAILQTWWHYERAAHRTEGAR